MRLQQLGEAKRRRRTGRHGEVDDARQKAEDLTRRVHQLVRAVVNINEDMSCSRLRSFLER